MVLNNLFLQNFRNYKIAEFRFDSGVNLVIGANATGKSNIIEGIYFLAAGSSRRAGNDKQLIHFGESFCRVKGKISDAREEAELEAIVSGDENARLQKRYLVNGVGKRRVDFAGYLTTVLFTPLDLEIVMGQPSARRRFMDEILEQTDYDYRLALSVYHKALRQRNALLEQASERGSRDEKNFAYWDDLLIRNGKIVSEKREDLVGFVNNRKKDLYEFKLEYDSSEISEERLYKYRDAELGAGVTLVGPHRDDVIILAKQEGASRSEDVKFFSSRGQQRLVVLELKLSQISFIKESKDAQPLLLLDDIFSELDEIHINHIFEFIGREQTIVTTTHRDFVPKKMQEETKIFELK